jgi:hypothetical protein
MNKYQAIKLIKESGLVIEKMTDEEKAAKRKERREARKAEEKAYRDAHMKFKCNKITGSGCFGMLYDLCKSMEGKVPEFNLFSGDHYGDEYINISWKKEDSNGEGHSAYLKFNIKELPRKRIICNLIVDGEDTGEHFEYKDPEAKSDSFFSYQTLNWEYRNGSSYEFVVTINKKAFTEWFQNISRKAIEDLDRKIKMDEDSSKNDGDRKIPDFKYMEFTFTDDPIDAMTGEQNRYKVPEDFVMKFFHENCGKDNDSYKDFKEFFDSLDISFMRSMSDEGSLMRGGFTFSQYKWFRRGGGELKGSLWSSPAFRGYDNDDVELKGWKLM